MSESDSSSESDVPLTKRLKPNPVDSSNLLGSSENVPTKSTKPGSASKNGTRLSTKPKDDSDSSESDSSSQDDAMSEVSFQEKRSRAGSASKAKQSSVKSASESGSDSEVPLIKRRKKSSSPVNPKRDSSSEEGAKPKKSRKKLPSASASDDPPRKQKAKVLAKAEKVKKEPKLKPKPAEDEYKWWLDTNKDETVKWTTLEHQGILFNDAYNPHGVPIKYKNVVVQLIPDCEEVATFYAQVIGTDFEHNERFKTNFFIDFLNLLKNQPNNQIKEFKHCDFSPIVQHLLRLKGEKLLLTKEDKLRIKNEKAAIDNIYGYCLLDGRREKVGNFRIEPPGLFRGRGEHPKTGCLKTRVRPEQVTLNIGKDAKVPTPPAGHQWGTIIHDNTVTWLAMWKENVNDAFKYVFLSANSSLKGQSDFKKFEKARQLKIHVSRIRKEYELELVDKVMATRQRATALYFIDKLALRAGNEKGEDEADTVGCCSLRFEHVTLLPPSTLVFDFLGKDSIRYYNEVQVTPQVFKNLKIFKKEPKKEGDALFDRLTVPTSHKTTLLNKHLSTFMDGLTAKVFRTFNASHTFQEELAKTDPNASLAEKILSYNRANRQVAILCNHQRAVSKQHSSIVGKLSDRILLIQYDVYQTQQQMIELDPRLKRKTGFIDEFPDELIEKCKLLLEQQQEVKLEKQNEKRKADGLEPIKASSSSPKKAPSTLEKLEKKLAALKARLETQNTQLIDKDENKTTALGTSKINYIDPRISSSWCQDFGVPLDKIFNRSLRDKFKWAMEVEKGWRF